jgi:hypothetical protein
MTEHEYNHCSYCECEFETSQPIVELMQVRIHADCKPKFEAEYDEAFEDKNNE